MGAQPFRAENSLAKGGQYGTRGAQFGAGVALDGERLVVGAPGSYNSFLRRSGYVGSAYIYERRNKQWVETHYLTPGEPRPGLFYGSSVALLGNSVYIGAEGSADADARAYAIKLGTNDWQEETVFRPPPTVAANFGSTGAISGDVVAVGAHSDINEKGGSAGAIYYCLR